MSEIQITIEGEGALEATQDLLAIPGLVAESQTEGQSKGVVETVVAIVGIVGGTVAIAEQIRKWYQEYQQGQQRKRIDKVLIITPKGRFLLEDATIEQIAKALEPLAK